MAISEEQLNCWSHQGSIAQSSATYKTIKSILETKLPFYGAKDFDVFLQGSYGNDTNIYAESDVDIIIKLNDSFYPNLDRLSEYEKTNYDGWFRSVPYTYVDFKNIVLDILTKEYGEYLLKGDKAITIMPNGNLRKVDVIAAFQSRHYHRFRNITDQAYLEGICFYDKNDRLIVNYPKHHSNNLTKKNQMTDGRFKPTVRIFKNLHKKLINTQMLEKDIATSYFLEGMLYNVPPEYFKGKDQDCIMNVLNWLQSTNRSEFVCANEQYYLFSHSSPTIWQETKCKAFLSAAIRFWNEC